MTRLHTSAPVRSRPATSGPGPRRNEKCVAASPLKEAFMLNRTPSSCSTFFRLTPTFLTARGLTAHSYRVDRGFGRCVDLTAHSRAPLGKREGSRGRAEAADRHHRSVLKHFSKEGSASSRMRPLTCCCRSARVELAGRAAVGTLSRLGFLVLPCCVFAGLRLAARRCLTEPPE